ncbi:UNVERIFIED_CONTAM: hypothetical protein Sradi_5222800 [Sesamum radiatum]|uniref:Aminotransferase-like plant mobile domain-containing protein n=1 Tax=Sesamum radiatum TaxID=300843 RepID=A0AAW2LMY1_SESRA
MTLLLYALWAVLSLKVMQSGMVILNLPESFITSKDIGSGLKELSILLRDLHDLAGLPVTGCLYDEVVPRALEFIPRSSKYLLYAYHLLQGVDDDRCFNVSIDKWVKFWSKKAIKYHLPPPRNEKKTVWPKSTHNPLGDITTHKRLSIAEEALFEKLCIEGNLKEEVYLAAYLACWLCTFVSSARMLTPFVQAPSSGIHDGEWSTSDKFIIEPYSPHRFGRQFGYFQDVLGTLKYDKRAASLEEGLHYWRLCILSKSSSKAWLPGLPTNAKKFCSEAHKVWWAKVHGTFLEDNITCLFSPRPPKIILKRKKHGDNQVDGGENSPSHVLVPPIVVKSNSQAEVVEKGKGFSHNLVDSDSSNKDRHWKRQKKELTPMKAIRLEDEVHSIDASEESETSHSSTMTPPLGMGKGKQLPHPPALSVFEGESFLFNHQKEFLQKLWSDLLVRISNTLVDFLSSIEDDVYLILESMKSFQKFDITKGRRTSLCAALKGQKQLNHDVQLKVNEVKENVATLKNTAPLDDEIVEDLESSKENIEDLKEDLKSLSFCLRVV